MTLNPQNLIELSHTSKNKIRAWVPFCTGFKKKGKSLQAFCCFQLPQLHQKPTE